MLAILTRKVFRNAVIASMASEQRSAARAMSVADEVGKRIPMGATRHVAGITYNDGGKSVQRVPAPTYPTTPHPVQPPQQ